MGSPHLLSSWQLKDLTLKNRVVLAPLTRARAGVERMPNALMAKYYAQRASAGLLISEATVVSQQGIGWLNSPGIYSDEQAIAWQQVTRAVHEREGRIFLQLWHCGRASHSSFQPDGGWPVSASAIAIQGDEIHTPLGKQPHELPRALATEEVPLVVEDYRRAAARAREAGFDGVEIHGANGYLIDQFLQSKTNQRGDRYGGDCEGRFQFLREIVEAVLTVWPAGRVGVRLSPNGIFNDMGSPDFREMALATAAQLDTFGIGYLHIMDGLAFGFHGLGEPMALREFRSVFSGTLMGNCGYTQETAEAAIARGDGDLIAFGRPYISNPDLVERFTHGWPLASDADMAVWYSFDEKGYADFPAYG
ncbi:MAG: alkene reductase [Oscillatoriales cyanobacterium SM2_2_1]|nr:alkene reductase [Oscillatoriales cyanobacterium SM2_2_1]